MPRRFTFTSSDINGWANLHFLAKKGSIEAAQVFFDHLQNHEKSIDLNQKDRFGNTALHIAIFNGKTQFALYLINKGFDVNQSNTFGWTYKNYLLKSEIDEQLPKVYLYNLLSKYLIHYTTEEEFMFLYVEKLNPLFRNNIIRSGSYYEHTRVGLPDEFDYMINLTEIERLCKFVENDSDPSGYGRLYPIVTAEAIEKLSCYLEPITQCISSQEILKQFYQLLTSARAHVIREETLIKFQHLIFHSSDDSFKELS